MARRRFEVSPTRQERVEALRERGNVTSGECCRELECRPAQQRALQAVGPGDPLLMLAVVNQVKAIQAKAHAMNLCPRPSSVAAVAVYEANPNLTIEAAARMAGVNSDTIARMLNIFNLPRKKQGARR